jgi:hypothetical protein
MPDDFVSVEKWGRTLPDVGHGLRGPAYLDVVARLPEHPDLEIRARIAPIDGTYEVVSLTLQCESGAVPAEALRQLPLRTLVREAVWSELRNVNLGLVISPPEGEDRSREATQLRDVAVTYQLARLIGDPPTVAVQNKLKVSRATAARRVAAARKAGFLAADEIGAGGGARSRLGGTD